MIETHVSPYAIMTAFIWSSHWIDGFDVVLLNEGTIWGKPYRGPTNRQQFRADVQMQGNIVVDGKGRGKQLASPLDFFIWNHVDSSPTPSSQYWQFEWGINFLSFSFCHPQAPILNQVHVELKLTSSFFIRRVYLVRAVWRQCLGCRENLCKTKRTWFL